MQFSNNNKLPQYLVDWLKSDDYDYVLDPLTLSATTLMKPVRVYWLSQRHADELEIDITDLISSRMGNAIHDSIEKIQTPNVNKEQRVIRSIQVDGITYTISGKYDVLVNENGKWTLRDIKTTSVWAYIFGGKDEDYQKQLSTYKWLLQDTCDVGNKAYIDFLFTDWQSSKAKLEDNYPPQRIHAGYEISLLSLEETEAYIVRRLKEFYNHKDLEDDNLPLCTQDELWATEDSYAVMKPEGKRAVKVCETLKEAQQYIRDKQVSNGFVEHRPGKAKRCKYCAAAPFCNQYKQLARKGQIDYF